MKKIVMFIGGVETQSFFTLQMKKTFEKFGHEVFLYDFTEEAKAASGLVKFIEVGNTVAIGFNYHGVCNEQILADDDGFYIWEAMGIPFYDIVVDHPFYYHRFVDQLPSNHIQISIDRNHEEYLERFYPELLRGPFLPLGGTELDWEGDDMLPIKDRPVDVIFTGSWAEPEFWEKYMYMDGPEYEKFYLGIRDEMIQNPDKTFEEVFEPRFREQLEEGEVLSDLELRETYSRLIYFDMYIRYLYRGELIRILADAGIKVLCVGGGWDKLPTIHPENITHIDYSDSIECLRQIRKAKISINVMPWFKRGAHDRIFNSCLNGAVCLTDSSEYLDTILRDNENCRLYRLDDLEAVPDMVKALLADEAKMQRIADAGYRMACGHTWGKRAEVLHRVMETEE